MLWRSLRLVMCVVELQRPKALRVLIAGGVPAARGFPFAKEARKTRIRTSVGGRSSMVELQIVILAVAGSSPVGHPARGCAAGNPKTQIPTSKTRLTRG